ncbi:hypothetical protein HK405_006428 [Cladochytrium tenue]|nr:hypothetical protein HK405_006428 [Cladochytrium tenue]
MFLRVKRRRTTLFVLCEPADTVSALRDRVAAMLSQTAVPASDSTPAPPPSAQGRQPPPPRLYFEKAIATGGGSGNAAAATGAAAAAASELALLEDATRIEQVGLKNDDCLVFAPWVPDSSLPEGGSFEPPSFESFGMASGSDEADPPVVDVKGKGH